MQTVAAPARSVRWRIPLVFGLTFFVNYLDRNNLALALPRIADQFGPGQNLDRRASAREERFRCG